MNPNKLEGALRVYVAAASSDLERAQHWMDELEAAGVEVTSDWVQVIRAVGTANPRNASQEDRRDWVADDLSGVADADVVWFLAPQSAPARGAYFEIGYAWGSGIEVVVSGDTRQSIFCAVGEEFDDDLAAYEYILSRFEVS
jgi:nucleoside 2-deoxyribosyltransferase